MSKVIGLLSAWGAEEWTELAIKQALKICDDVVLNVGPYAPNVVPFRDNTEEIAKKFLPHIRIVESESTGQHNTSKAATLNKMLTTSPYHKVGNAFWVIDVDEYYFEDDATLMKDELFGGDYTHVVHDEKYFFINMQHYLRHERTRLIKIVDIDQRFKPTQKWAKNRDKPYRHWGPGEHHYSALMNPYVKKEVWKTESRSHAELYHPLVHWTDEVYLKYELDNEDYWNRRNKALFGVLTPFWKGDMAADENGRLYHYSGPHPQVIEDAGLPQIPDFRKRYNPL